MFGTKVASLSRAAPVLAFDVAAALAGALERAETAANGNSIQIKLGFATVNDSQH